MTDPPTAPRALTRRQQQILILIANGHTNTQIGHALGVTRTTIDRHLAALYQELGASDRANAVAIAMALRILHPDQIHIPDQQRETAA